MICIVDEIKKVARDLGLDDLSLNFSKSRIKLKLDRDCILFQSENLDALNIISKTHLEKFDLCYIDPPYNTKNKFVYHDKRVSKEVGIFGTHKEWMSFILPRLVFAKHLLRETGIIAISIDDNEQPYLRVLLDRIFGEVNFIGNIVVCRSKNGKGSKKNISLNHEYIIVYGKSKKSKLLGLKESNLAKYDKEDDYGYYTIDGLFRKKGDGSLREERPNMHYPLYYDEFGTVFVEKVNEDLKEIYPVDSKGIKRRWLWDKDKAKRDSWLLYASKNGVVYVKNYNSESKRVKIRSLWNENRYLTERATNQAKEIFGERVFETAKPIELIEDLIFSHAHENAKIIDFFSGSGTTAHAAHNLNKVDRGKRQVVLVEYNEPIDKKHIAFKLGFKRLSDITKHRLEWIKKVDNSYSFKSYKL